jgi:hypothetical protein
MRSIQFICLLGILLFANTLSAQYIQLIENRGELGVMGGGSYYHGDIASDKLFYQPNFGAFYKKQMNDYVGIRLNYEYLAIGANDIQSSNPYEKARGLKFSRTAHDVSIMGEFYFLKFINGNKRFRFSPYLGFGMGALKTITSTSNYSGASKRTYVYPINLGFKYNVTGPWNIFGEATYRFTNSDNLDFFADSVTYIHPTSGVSYQASSSGNDQYFTTKLGISYNLLEIYGPDKLKKPKKSFFPTMDDKQRKSSKKGIFSFFKRK